MILSFLRRYFWVFSTIAAFSAGWYSGYTYYNVKQLEIDLKVSNEQVKNRDKIIAINAQNITNRDAENLAIKNQRDIIESKLNDQKRINALDKDYINKHNVITRDLLLRVGALRAENNKLSENVTTTVGIISADEALSPYEYAQWAVGLRAHDNMCVIRYNGLLERHNKEQILINGFKND